MTWINHPSRSTEEQGSGCFGKWSWKGRTVLPAHAMKTPLHQGRAAKGPVCSYTRDPDGAPGCVSTGTPPPLAAAEGSQHHTTGGTKVACCIWRGEERRGWIPTGTPGTGAFCSCHRACFNVQPFFVTMWFSTLLPFGWRLDFPQGCLLHHILKAAGLELGKR